MYKRTVGLIGLMALVVALALPCYAGPREKQQDIEKLLVLTGTPGMMDQVQLQVSGMFNKMIQQKQIPPVKQPTVRRYFEKVEAMMRVEFAWEKMKEPMTKIYDDVYSEAEIRELIEFYESPIGQKMIQKMPELMQASMQMSQQMIQGFIPKLQNIIAELERELQQPPAQKR